MGFQGKLSIGIIVRNNVAAYHNFYTFINVTHACVVDDPTP